MGWEIEGKVSLMVMVHIYTLLYMNIQCKSIQGAMNLKEYGPSEAHRVTACLVCKQTCEYTDATSGI